MTEQPKDIGEKVDEVFNLTPEDIMKNMKEDFDGLNEVLDEVRALSDKVFAGDATEDDLNEFKHGLGEIYQGFCELVSELFGDVHEVPFSDRAITFYSLMDCFRAVLGMDSRSLEIMTDLTNRLMNSIAANGDESE